MPLMLAMLLLVMPLLGTFQCSSIKTLGESFSESVVMFQK
jgi:hypothetical protein